MPSRLVDFSPTGCRVFNLLHDSETSSVAMNETGSHALWLVTDACSFRQSFGSASLGSRSSDAGDRPVIHKPAA